MFNSAKYFIVSTVICIFTISGFSTPQVVLQKDDIQEKQSEVRNIFSSDLKISKTNSFLNNILTVKAADDASVLAGVWRMQFQSSICLTQMEQVFQPNGGYSSYAQCSNGSYAVQGSGTWRILQRGSIRVQYTKKSGLFRDGETMTYQIVDRNRVKFYGIMAYRTQ